MRKKIPRSLSGRGDTEAHKQIVVNLRTLMQNLSSPYQKNKLIAVSNLVATLSLGL